MAVSGEEFERMRQRVHNMNDTLQEHRLKYERNSQRIETLEQRTDRIQDTMVTGDGLKDSLAVITVKLENLSDQIEPLRKAIYWAATLIVGSVMVALIAQILKP